MRRWFLSYNSADLLLARDLRGALLSSNPGDDVFFIFNESRVLEDGTIVGQVNRSFIVKLTRSWDF